MIANLCSLAWIYSGISICICMELCDMCARASHLVPWVWGTGTICTSMLLSKLICFLKFSVNFYWGVKYDVPFCKCWFLWDLFVVWRWLLLTLFSDPTRGCVCFCLCVVCAVLLFYVVFPTWFLLFLYVYDCSLHSIHVSSFPTIFIVLVLFHKFVFRHPNKILQLSILYWTVFHYAG